MKFNFDFNPAAMTSETIIAMIFAAIIFIAIPIVLAFVEYRLTQKNKQAGLYLMIGVFATTVLLGLYSVFVGLLLLIIYFVALGRGKGKQQIDNHTIQPVE